MGMDVPADATNNMIVNYVLSKSKDMPVPDELSDQVKIWIYISRFALWNSLLSTTYISGSISKVPVLIFLLACSSILEDITLLRETANFRIVSPSIPQDFGDLTYKLKNGKSRRRSSGSC